MAKRRIEARFSGPASGTIRNIAHQMLLLSEDGALKKIHLQLGCGGLLDAAEQVERLEAMAVPESQKAGTADLESGKVVAFEAARVLAIGGAVSAPVRRRGPWGRFKTFIRRL